MIIAEGSRISFYVVADFITGKTCKVHRSYGKCNCVRRRGKPYNPCDRAQEVIEYCLARAADEMLLGSIALVDVVRWMHFHRCRKSQEGRICSHSSCETAETLLAWLEAVAVAETAPRDKKGKQGTKQA
jgi:hypothetical protein